MKSKNLRKKLVILNPHYQIMHQNKSQGNRILIVTQVINLM